MKFETFTPHNDNGKDALGKEVNNADKNPQGIEKSKDTTSEKNIFKTLSEIAKDGYQYRAIGSEGFRDIQETGMIRPSQNPKPRITEGDLTIKAKHQDAPFFVDAKYINTIEGYNSEYIIEYPSNIDGVSFSRPQGDFGNVPWKDDAKIYELPADRAIIYKKVPEGYVQVDTL